MSEVHGKVVAKEGRKTATKAPELRLLQPSRDAFKVNVQRAHIQTAILKSALDSEPPAFDPAEYGCERGEHTRRMIPVTLPPNVVVAPPEVLDMIKCGSSTDTTFLTAMCGCLDMTSYIYVALRENFVDRRESYDLFSAKSCIFLVHEKTHAVWVYFSIPIHNLPQSKVSKYSLDIFLLLSYHH
jgi:hypothetical protein